MANEAVDDLDVVLRHLRQAPRPLLIGLDIDGTLSEIVAHASQARLVEGVLESIEALDRHDGVRLVLVTGRSMADARATFGLPDRLTVVGSHGQERSGASDTATAPDVAADQALTSLEEQAHGHAAGVDGAWVERKPFSVTVHVRQAEPMAGAELLERFEESARAAGATVLHGSAVVEAGFGPLDKGEAVERLRAEWGVASVCFVGDDVTDERVFARLGGGDIAVKVGDADTLAASQARWRLADPERVAMLLNALHSEL